MGNTRWWITGMDETKYLLLWERMGDYHRARWKSMAKQIGEGRCIAADLGTDDGLYQWHSTKRDPNHEVLVRKPVSKIATWEAFRAFRRIAKSRQVTHVAIPGYGRACYLWMMLWARLTGRKVIMFAESWYPGNPILDVLKGLLVRLLANGCFVSGERARNHFISRLGCRPSKIRTGYSVVDNNHFSPPLTAGPRADQSSHPKELLCVARFAPEKNLDLLIQGFRRSILSKTWKLVLVGGGPSESDLKSLANGAPIEFLPWQDYESLPGVYSKSSCFVLPSKIEPWGLVVNEAMAAGLPVILSNAVGAAPDLLSEDQNGWSFDYQSEDELVAWLDRLAGLTRAELDAMGNRSREIVNQYSLDAWTSAMTQLSNPTSSDVDSQPNRMTRSSGSGTMERHDRHPIFQKFFAAYEKR